MEQIAFDGFVTCDRCEYGRELGANDYGCRCPVAMDKRVHKGDYTCYNAKERK